MKDEPSLIAGASSGRGRLPAEYVPAQGDNAVFTTRSIEATVLGFLRELILD